MKLIVKKDYDSMSKEAAYILADEIRSKPDIVLGLATGSTPEGMYRELIRMHKEEGLDFSKVTTFNLDEYIGLDENNSTSYHYFMKEKLFNHINIDIRNTFVPNGNAEDLIEYCRKYDEEIEKKGGIDIQILGVGENGHIGFNEPDDELNMNTSIVRLTEDTIQVNSRFFDTIDDVPRTAITMGIGSIMRAKKIILLANGRKKAKVIKELLKKDKISTRLPVSILLLHPNFTLIIDEEAKGEI